MNEEKVIPLTKKQALECLQINNGVVHCFTPSPLGLIGADWPLKDVEVLMDKATEDSHIQVAGPDAQAMHHGVGVIDTENNRLCFFESEKEKMQVYLEGQE